MRAAIPVFMLAPLFTSACATLPAEPQITRADICQARMEQMIEEAAAVGPVAGPSWFIRDWWEARREIENEPSEAWQALRERIDARPLDDEARSAELQSCVDEAIEAGALP